MEVGRDKKHFTLSTHLLITKSEYFRAAETSERKVRLEDVDVKDFKWFATWLYNETTQRLIFDYGRPVVHACMRLYILAERFACTTLQNQCVDTLIHRQVSESVDVSDFQYAWEHTAPDSRFQTLLMDFYLDDRDLRETFNALSPNDIFGHNFLFALAKLHNKNGNNEIYRLKFDDGSDTLVEEELPNRCKRYHVHKDNREECEGLGSFAIGPEDKWKDLA